MARLRGIFRASGAVGGGRWAVGGGRSEEASPRDTQNAQRITHNASRSPRIRPPGGATDSDAEGFAERRAPSAESGRSYQSLTAITGTHDTFSTPPVPDDATARSHTDLRRRGA